MRLGSDPGELEALARATPIDCPDRSRRLAFTAAIAAFAATLSLAAMLTTPADAAFPGQNGRIAFSSDRDGDDEIYRMTPGGGDVRQLTFTGAGIVDEDPTFSPNGRQIIFESDRGGPTTKSSS